MAHGLSGAVGGMRGALAPWGAPVCTHVEAQIKDQLGQRVRAMTGATGYARDFLQPAGDPGLLGPASAAWQVHAHFVAHDERRSVLAFAAGAASSGLGCGLGPFAFSHPVTGAARPLPCKPSIGSNRIHAQIRGTLPDSTPYVANDPELIRWVHLGETRSFLQAYQDLSLQPLPAHRQDLYFADMAPIGERLGAQNLPLTRHQALTQLQDFRPELRVDERTRETAALIEHYPCAPRDRPMVRLIVRAASELLPDWALGMLERKRSCPLEQAALRTALHGMGASLAWAFADTGVAARASAHGVVGRALLS